MMLVKTLKFKYLLIFSLIAITSCLRDTFPDTDPCPCDDEQEVTLNLALPYVAPRLDTRAIGAAQENAIETLDVLAFMVKDGVETFQYRVEARRGAGSVMGASRQTFTARLRVREYPQRLVLISNARSKIETLINSRATGGWIDVEKEEMLSQLTLNLNGSDRWNASSAVNYTLIPMWSETAPEIISETTAFVNQGAIPMLRMMAKVEVQVDKTVPGLTNNFKLKAITIARIYKKRWSIETMFKNVKQNFQLKYFYGDSANAIEIQVWCVLIACLLVALFKAMHKIQRMSFSNMMFIVRCVLMEYVWLHMLLAEPERTLMKMLFKQNRANAPPTLFD